LAYLTAEEPGKAKAEVLMEAVNTPHIFGEDYAKLSTDKRFALQTWSANHRRDVQRLLTWVMKRALSCRAMSIATVIFLMI